jgi:chorismate synthase
MHQTLHALRVMTAGESHGAALVTIIEGLPAGIPIDLTRVDAELARRQRGYGRGRRMAIESDRAEVLAGIDDGRTTGAAVALRISNRDWPNWQRTMAITSAPPADATGVSRPTIRRPRPGHADLAGAVKLGRHDIRDVLERASARETAARVAAGGIAREVLRHAGVEIASCVVSVGHLSLQDANAVTWSQIKAIPADSPLSCPEPDLERRMVDAITAAREAGDTLGGAFIVVVRGTPPGLGAATSWDRRLDGRLAQALMCIQSVKAVEVDSTSGGIENGLSTGEDLRLTIWLKPISTLMNPLRSVDLDSFASAPAAIERSDVCVVPAGAVVGEAMTALVLADAWIEHRGRRAAARDLASD